ncbi:MAG TPA: hypothetical protein VNA24_18515 [Hyalangium sp.]|jgi:hypothetical protein|nr:hypothetical protein [Hyalangium sp.]
MKTFAVALLFILSLVTLFGATGADALSQPSIQPGLSRLMPPAKGDDDKKDDKKDDEEDEEEYRGRSSRTALERAGGMTHPVRQV